MIPAVSESERVDVLIGLGANLGDPQLQLQMAVRELELSITIDAVSSLYLTSPVGLADQPDFLNLVLRGGCTLPAGELMRRARKIEEHSGRAPSVRDGPRTLDIDLLAYGQERIDVPGLTVPHPRMHQRRFVLEPLVEVDPDWVHPELRLTAAEMLDGLSSCERVVRLGRLEARLF
ncbi:MAG: 2-amino-4-hydroxy-6-hydroxymethyldihydropteridine diphosphokinase [Gemmatimonadetes bacterium]|nr:2-amino-4-hydroxy-6-hydroxymethyldihydropteridine diphosphokinase [Gemmatimonadota bacterium]